MNTLTSVAVLSVLLSTTSAFAEDKPVPKSVVQEVTANFIGGAILEVVDIGKLITPNNGVFDAKLDQFAKHIKSKTPNENSEAADVGAVVGLGSVEAIGATAAMFSIGKRIGKWQGKRQAAREAAKEAEKVAKETAKKAEKVADKIAKDALERQVETVTAKATINTLKTDVAIAKGGSRPMDEVLDGLNTARDAGKLITKERPNLKGLGFEDVP